MAAHSPDQAGSLAPTDMLIAQMPTPETVSDLGIAALHAVRLYVGAVREVQELGGEINALVNGPKPREPITPAVEGALAEQVSVQGEFKSVSAQIVSLLNVRDQ